MIDFLEGPQALRRRASAGPSPHVVTIVPSPLGGAEEGLAADEPVSALAGSMGPARRPPAESATIPVATRAAVRAAATYQQGGYDPYRYRPQYAPPRTYAPPPQGPNAPPGYGAGHPAPGYPAPGYPGYGAQPAPPANPQQRRNFTIGAVVAAVLAVLIVLHPFGGAGFGGTWVGPATQQVRQGATIPVAELLRDLIAERQHHHRLRAGMRQHVERHCVGEPRRERHGERLQRAVDLEVGEWQHALHWVDLRQHADHHDAGPGRRSDHHDATRDARRVLAGLFAPGQDQSDRRLTSRHAPGDFPLGLTWRRRRFGSNPHRGLLPEWLIRPRGVYIGCAVGRAHPAPCGRR